MVGPAKISLETLENAIKVSRVFLLFWDDKMFDSDWVRKEVSFAGNHGRPIYFIVNIDHHNPKTRRTTREEHGLKDEENWPPHVRKGWTGVQEDGSGYSILDMWHEGGRLTEEARLESTKHVLGTDSHQMIEYGQNKTLRKAAFEELVKAIKHERHAEILASDIHSETGVLSRGTSKLVKLSGMAALARGLEAAKGAPAATATACGQTGPCRYGTPHALTVCERRSSDA